MDSPQEISQLLLAWEQGDQSALERLMLLVEKELRRLAKSYMRKEKKGHSLQTTDLVNEAYLKLVDQKRVHWKSRAHFFGIAATCMRRVLCDYAKAENRKKRGSGLEHIALSDVQPMLAEKSVELLALDEALQKLAEQDARKSQVVEMRYFGGYTVEEVAAILEISKETVAREWRMARAWLKREMDPNSKVAL
jgi:RNA polymerase sigma-70 factor (ECF subfamily)